jgi:hypothetical protein
MTDVQMGTNIKLFPSQLKKYKELKRKKQQEKVVPLKELSAEDREYYNNLLTEINRLVESLKLVSWTCSIDNSLQILEKNIRRLMQLRDCLIAFKEECLKKYNPNAYRKILKGREDLIKP